MTSKFSNLDSDGREAPGNGRRTNGAGRAADAKSDVATRRADWDARVAREGRESPGPFITTSSRPINRLYSPTDVPDLDYTRDLANPGEYPFTRGVHLTGYRGKEWTMRMFAGFGAAEDTNARFRYLVEHGGTGLSCA